MFTMMNRARLAVGVQGVGIAEAATQQALAYARERKQGRTAGMKATESAPIIAHPDVKRMLLTMRALTGAARAICYATAMALDRAERRADEAARKAAHDRLSLLTPVAKAFSTDIANEVTSLGIQVHGGMGFIEETGAAQLFRDARIAAIYEGTNGIQAIDLVTRKLPLGGGAAVAAHLEDLRGIVEAVSASNDPAFGWTPVRLGEAVESLARATHWLLGQNGKDADAALAGATSLSAAVRHCHRRLLPGAAGARRDAARRGGAATPRAGALFCREFRRSGRRARTHRGRRRARRDRRRRGVRVSKPKR